MLDSPQKVAESSHRQQQAIPRGIEPTNVVAMQNFQSRPEHPSTSSTIPNPFTGKIPDVIWHDTLRDRLSDHLDMLPNGNPWRLLQELAHGCSLLRSQIYHPAALKVHSPTLWDAYKLYNQIAAYYTLTDTRVLDDHTEVHEYLGLPVGCLLDTLSCIRAIHGIDIEQLDAIIEDIEYEVVSAYEKALEWASSSTLSSHQWSAQFRTTLQTEDVVYEQLSLIKHLIPRRSLLQYKALALKVQESASEVVEAATHFGSLIVEMSAGTTTALIYNWTDYWSSGATSNNDQPSI